MLILYITADKTEIKDFSKLPWATSFIRRTLYAIRELVFYRKKIVMMLLSSFNFIKEKRG